jgi:hypothetical protein
MAWRAGNVLVALLGVVASFGAGEEREKTDVRAALVQQIRELAYVVPAEFGADALLQLAEMGFGGSPKERRLLLQEIFRMAGGATFKHAWFYTGLASDTRYDSLGLAYDLRLDGESLRLRAVELLLPLDRSMAREWFEAAVFRPIPLHDCRRPLKYDVRRRYRTLGAVVGKGFTAQERAQEEHLRYAESFLRSLSSPVEVIPAAMWLLSLDLLPDQFAKLVHTFSSAVTGLPADDRAFDLGLDRFSLGDVIEATDKGLEMPEYGNVISAIDKLIARCAEAGVSCEALVSSLRVYLAKQLQGVRCADSIRRASYLADRSTVKVEPIATMFNQWKRRLPPYVSREVPPLAEEETAPAKVGEAAHDFEYWDTSDAKSLLRSVQELRFGRRPPGLPGTPRPQPLSLETRKTHGWTTELHDFLKRLESWKPAENELEIDHFYKRARLYQSLIELVPQGIEREQVLQRYLHFLVQSRFQQEKPVEWFVPVRELLHRLKHSKLTEAGADKRHDRDVDWVLGELERAGSPILTLYVKLERLKAVSAAHSR